MSVEVNDRLATMLLQFAAGVRYHWVLIVKFASSAYSSLLRFTTQYPVTITTYQVLSSYLEAII